MTDSFAAVPAASGMIRSIPGPRGGVLGLRRWLFGLAAFVLSAGLAHAAEPWKILPPTPPLPALAHEGHAEVNGVRIWYAQWNDQAGGVPVLLLHGGYGNSNYFGHLIPTLAKHGFRVIAMDSRGHGRSARNAAPYTYHLMAEDVIALLDTLHVRRVSLVGWSDGGCIGYDLALNHPERLARLFAFGADADVSGLKDGFDKDPVFAAYLTHVRQEYHALSPTPNDWEGFNAAVNQMWETLPAFTAAQLKTFSTPTTIADGEHDEGIRPEHNRYLAATIPNARLLILPNVSHFAMLQNPAEFNGAVLDFLARE
jgi:pimeloyl-ACP methyl ester carboxylesterase